MAEPVYPPATQEYSAPPTVQPPAAAAAAIAFPDVPMTQPFVLSEFQRAQQLQQRQNNHQDHLLSPYDLMPIAPSSRPRAPVVATAPAPSDREVERRATALSGPPSSSAQGMHAPARESDMRTQPEDTLMRSRGHPSSFTAAAAVSVEDTETRVVLDRVCSTSGRGPAAQPTGTDPYGYPVLEPLPPYAAASSAGGHSSNAAPLPHGTVVSGRDISRFGESLQFANPQAMPVPYGEVHEPVAARVAPIQISPAFVMGPSGVSSTAATAGQYQHIPVVSSVAQGSGLDNVPIAVGSIEGLPPDGVGATPERVDVGKKRALLLERNLAMSQLRHDVRSFAFHFMF